MRHIAATAARNADLCQYRFARFEDDDAEPFFRGRNCAEETCCTTTDHNDICHLFYSADCSLP